MGSAAAWPASSAARVGHAGALEHYLVSGYAVNAIFTQLTNGKNSMGECGTSFASFFSGTCRSRGSLGAVPRQRLRCECHSHPVGQRQELHARMRYLICKLLQRHVSVTRDLWSNTSSAATP